MKWNDFYNKSEWLLKKLIENTNEPTDDNNLKEIVKRLKTRGYVQRKISEQEDFDYLKAYQEVVGHHRHKTVAILKIAVSILIILSSGSILYFLQKQTILKEITIATTNILPGRPKARLVTNNGQEVELGIDTLLITEQKGLNIFVDSMGLHYNPENTVPEQESKYHKLIVPRGGEYTLTLSDGTKVWLNADSELRYPINFSNNTRKVFVSGEAYFKVAKKVGTPFIVETKLGNITVLGTEFNFQYYPNSTNATTTLVNGKISYCLNNGKSIVLTPNQQLIVSKEGKEQLITVDTKYATCWKEGMYYFQEKTLEEILEQLERWYDIHVFYTNDEIKNLHFSGDLSRFKNIDTFIEMLEKSSDIKIEIKERNLIVSK